VGCCDTVDFVGVDSSTGRISHSHILTWRLFLVPRMTREGSGRSGDHLGGDLVSIFC